MNLEKENEYEAMFRISERITELARFRCLPVSNVWSKWFDVVDPCRGVIYAKFSEFLLLDF